MAEEDAIEFISYDGEYPCLCMGILTVKINNKTYSFGDEWDEMSKKHPRQRWCPRFWSSGGKVCRDDDWNMWTEYGEWEWSCWHDKESFPDEVWSNREKLIELFNGNVRQGCCGGCI